MCVHSRVSTHKETHAEMRTHRRQVSTCRDTHWCTYTNPHKHAGTHITHTRIHRCTHAITHPDVHPGKHTGQGRGPEDPSGLAATL